MKLSRMGDPPDFINDEGVKWWKVGPMWMVEIPSGESEYVALEDGRVGYASTQFEAVALWQEMREAPKVPTTDPAAGVLPTGEQP